MPVEIEVLYRIYVRRIWDVVYACTYLWHSYVIEYAPVECMYMRETGTVEQVSAYVRVRGGRRGRGRAWREVLSTYVPVSHFDAIVCVWCVLLPAIH